MSAADRIERMIKDRRLTTRAAVDERILAEASAALKANNTQPLGDSSPGVWRRIMRSRYTRIGAAAAAVAAVAILFPTLWSKSVASAYAFEQTVEANRLVRAIHVRIDPSDGGLAEAWADFDPNGKITRLRNDFEKGPDGSKVVVWQDGKALVWFKDKKGASLLPEKDMLRRLRPDQRLLYDPRAFVEVLYRAQADGKVKLQATEPTRPNEDISLTMVPRDGQTGWREEFKIDAATKLLRRFDKYQSKDGKDTLVMSVQYLEYNEAVDPNAYDVKLPDGVTVVDQTAADLGLSRGEASKDDIARKVAQEFFEALVAKDYDRAGKLCGGIPAERVRTLIQSLVCARVVAIGSPTPHPDPKTEFLQVPCQIEVTTNGSQQVKTYTLNIRPLYNRPDRWAIGGGDVFKTP